MKKRVGPMRVAMKRLARELGISEWTLMDRLEARLDIEPRPVIVRDEARGITRGVLRHGDARPGERVLVSETKQDAIYRYIAENLGTLDLRKLAQ
jgi:hypothetical protein